MEAAGKERAAEIDAWGGRLHTYHMPATESEFRQRVVQLKVPCVAASERLNCPFVNRRMAGASGRASATDAGRSGVFLTSVLSNATGVERLSSSGLSTAPTTVTLSFWMVPAARMASTRCGAPSTKVTSTVSSWKPGAVMPTWYEPGAGSASRT